MMPHPPRKLIFRAGEHLHPSCCVVDHRSEPDEPSLPTTDSRVTGCKNILAVKLESLVSSLYLIGTYAGLQQGFLTEMF
jgi:hypothetical protein